MRKVSNNIRKKVCLTKTNVIPLSNRSEWEEEREEIQKNLIEKKKEKNEILIRKHKKIIKWKREKRDIERERERARELTARKKERERKTIQKQ